MFTDMVGYSALAQADEATALKVLDRHNRLLRPLFAQHGGREVKTVGDAFLVEFPSALEAVQGAVAIQRALHEYNEGSAEAWRIRLRIGVHVGDVVRAGDDVLGDAVNLAARIETLAEPEGIALSQQVVDQVRNKLDLPLARLPSVPLKNITNAPAVYRVVRTWRGESGPAGTAPAPADGRHLAVLPLANISPDPADAYFADGLTEELISVLSHVPDLGVIARTSVMPYKSQAKSIAQVGAELGVDTVLEGSVRKAGPRIRITLQLIDVGTQRHLWAESYDRELDDVFAVQSDVARRTGEALRLQLARREGSAASPRPTPNPAAYDLYLRGLVAGNDLTPSHLAEAAACFQQATELDPTFAEAYATWADFYVAAAGDSVAMREVMPRARQLAARAVALDPASSEAHAALGNIAFQSDHNWERAEEEFRRAIALNPSNVSAHRFYALMLIALERFDEAREMTLRAARLDPRGSHRMTLGLVELGAGHYDRAIALAQEEVDADPTSLSRHIARGFFCARAGRLEVARAEAATPAAGANDEERYDLALLRAVVGQPEAGRAMLAEIAGGGLRTYISGTHRAMLHGAVGEGARALDLLEEEFREGDAVLWLYYRGPWFDSIRGEPRFLALLRSYGLSPGAPSA